MLNDHDARMASANARTPDGFMTAQSADSRRGLNVSPGVFRSKSHPNIRSVCVDDAPSDKQTPKVPLSVVDRFDTMLAYSRVYV